MLTNPETKKKATSWKIWTWPLHWQVLLGLILGALVGWLLGWWGLDEAQGTGQSAGNIVTEHPLYLCLDLVGDLFLNGLKLIVVPLVVSSIVVAMAGIGAERGLGRLGLKTLGYYGLTSLLAIVLGLVLVNVVAPGFHEGQGILEGQDLSAFASSQAEVVAKTQGRTSSDFLDTFRSMVPPNVFSAAANNGQLLGLIVVALVSGFFLARMKSDGAKSLLTLVEGVYELTLKITGLVLAFTPIGVLGLVGATMAEQYAKLAGEGAFGDFLQSILVFAAVALASLLIHALVTMPILLAVVARVNPLRHLHAMAPALLTAFSSASSSSTLPVTLECVQDRAGVSKKTSSFVLPLGATVNMDGTALYECVAAMFICQAFGVELSIGQQFFVVMTALLTSIGVAGVPSASLVAIVVILEGVQRNLPAGESVALVSGLGVLMFFDRPLDMCRTAVNVFSDSVGAVIIAKSEGESPLAEPVAAMEAKMHG